MELSRFTNPGELVATCEKFDFRLIVNYQTGIGHLIAEADNFLRMKHLGHIERDRTYVLLVKPHPAHSGFGECFDDVFDIFISDEQAFFALREVALFRPDLMVDIGTSDWKLAPTRNREHRTIGQGFLACRTRRDDTIPALRAYWSRARESRAHTPWPWKRRAELPAPLCDFLKLGDRKLALIQYKPNLVNATGGVTSPETYEPTLSFLNDEGYRLVFVGREDMPSLFTSHGVVNYAHSEWATIANDLRLFRNAAFAMISGSGLGHCADVFGVPYVYFNTWHTFLPQPSPLCVEIPAIARDPATGRLMTLSQQAELFTTRDQYADWNYPAQLGDARLASGEEILAAAREALSLGRQFQEKSPLQRSVDDIDPLGMRQFAESRFAQSFIERHAEIIA